MNQLKHTIGRALRPARAGAKKLVATELGSEENAVLAVSSPAFDAGDTLPLSATADAKDGSAAPPRIEWSGAPASTRSIAIVVEDPDAPFPQPFVHWLVYALPPTATRVEGGREGKNSRQANGFTPAAPPPGHGVHHYHFQVFALDTDLDLAEGAGRTELVDAMRGHVVAWGEIVGSYMRR